MRNRWWAPAFLHTQGDSVFYRYISCTKTVAGTVEQTMTGPQPAATDQKYYFPRELENKYTDIAFVGRGGIAWVFSAIRKIDGVKVAVKIPISFDEMTGRSFLNEIKAWETLRHANIVEVSAVNILPVPYVEMEFVPARSRSWKNRCPSGRQCISSKGSLMA